jgi:molybdenum cofactor cytidylyltransferase
MTAGRPVNPASYWKWLGAVVLAAGQSRRMGQPKQVLPWGSRTVIEQVVGTLEAAGVGEIVVVTGAARELVEAALSGQRAQTVYNPAFAEAEMLSSLKVGMRSLSENIRATLVVLGDQPGIEESVVREVVEAHIREGARLVIPSYQMRRGHPWLLEQSLWAELLALPEDKTLRDFLDAQREEIVYANVNSPAILKDVDTPEDYRQQKPPED